MRIVKCEQWSKHLRVCDARPQRTWWQTNANVGCVTREEEQKRVDSVARSCERITYKIEHFVGPGQRQSVKKIDFGGRFFSRACMFLFVCKRPTHLCGLLDTKLIKDFRQRMALLGTKPKVRRIHNILARTYYIERWEYQEYQRGYSIVFWGRNVLGERRLGLVSRMSHTREHARRPTQMSGQKTCHQLVAQFEERARWNVCVY